MSSTIKTGERTAQAWLHDTLVDIPLDIERNGRTALASGICFAVGRQICTLDYVVPGLPLRYQDKLVLREIKR